MAQEETIHESLTLLKKLHGKQSTPRKPVINIQRTQHTKEILIYWNFYGLLVSKHFTLSFEKKLEKFKCTVVEIHKSLVVTKSILLLSPAFSSIHHSEKDVPKEAITLQKQSNYGTSSIQLSISIKSFLPLANFSHPLASEAFSPSQCSSFPRTTFFATLIYPWTSSSPSDFTNYLHFLYPFPGELSLHFQ